MNGKCSIVFWDVQHGHASYINSPNNRHIVVDLGTGDFSQSNYEFSPLKYLKFNCNINQLDFVVITHPHLDHIDDILNFDLLSPIMFCRPNHLSNQEVMSGVRLQDFEKFKTYCELNDKYNNLITASSYNNISNPANWGEMKIYTFVALSCDHKNFNNHSIVVVIEYAGVKVIIPGDNENCSFKELMDDQNFYSIIEDSDILLAPHHGRESGFNLEFINQVNPRLTVVSDGRFCETSAKDRYSTKSRGWTVSKKNGSSSIRKCLTTNSDGTVTINFGYSPDPNYHNFLEVVTEK